MIIFIILTMISEGLLRNKIYIERCGYDDNGRVKTWLPYRSSKSSVLLHDVTKEQLLGDQTDKYYVVWYDKPEVYKNINYVQN